VPSSVDRVTDLSSIICTAAGHLEIRAATETSNTFVHAAPVGHHEACESPLISQDIAKQVFVLGGIDAIYKIVGAHHGPGPTLLHRDFERRKIDLVQGALIDIRARGHSLELLIVDRIVLEGGAHSLTLHPFDV